MRVAILWKQMSGHSKASFAALRDAGAELLLVHRTATSDAPYVEADLDLGVPTERWTTRPDEPSLQRWINAFEPEALLVCSWDVGGYRRVARSMAGRTLRLLFMDNAWLGTPKQWGGRLVSPLVIRPSYDAAFLPGERQAAFARRLGVAEDRILWGAYTCDHARFAAVAAERPGLPPPVFAYAGRLVPEKGIDVLAQAYRRYRSLTSDPWPLLIAGSGPLAGALAGIDGVEMLGFVQPDRLPEVFARAGCFVLPSRFEPWGVVIHEAASAAMAIVCTAACGASTRLVLDGYNGAVVPSADPDALAGALSYISRHGDLGTLSTRSTELARQFTPARWASYLLEQTARLRGQLGLATS